MQVCKTFYNAMQSHLLWKHVTLQDCSVINKAEAPVWMVPWQLTKEHNPFAGHISPPKKLVFMSVHFLGYLKRYHCEHVVELDLSFAPLMNQVTTLVILFLLYASNIYL